MSSMLGKNETDCPIFHIYQKDKSEIEVMIAKLVQRIEEVESRNRSTEKDLRDLMEKIDNLIIDHARLSTKFTFWSSVFAFVVSGAFGVVMKLLYEVLAKVSGVK